MSELELRLHCLQLAVQHLHKAANVHPAHPTIQ